ncbi:hypothetical protein ABTZ03_09675 [Kitasatospora sp. NPDC096077]|uniref:hypothetical protein n=1 Tax=Kitasatospora sp. NPDC096077 TaxID=3155544 RepID=UPI0033165F68
MIGIQTALGQLDGTVGTEMPAEHQYRLGRCLPCDDGKWTVVAPGVFYAWGGGMASIPACKRHHEAFVRYSRQQSMRADLGPRGKDWS